MRAQDAWHDHATFMNALVSDGFVILGGPLGDDETVLLAVDADSEHEVHAKLTEDPWTELGLLEISRVDVWDVLLERDSD